MDPSAGRDGTGLKLRIFNFLIAVKINVPIYNPDILAFSIY